jgi:VanZ family protein
MAALFTASSVPGDDLPNPFWDKGVHFLVYAGLGVLFLVPLAMARLKNVTFRVALKAIALSTVYGIFDELHQSFTPDRSPDVRDLFADVLGATLGVVCVMVLRSIVRSLRRDGDNGLNAEKRS